MKKQIILIQLFLWGILFAAFSQEKSGNEIYKPGKLFSFTEMGVLAGNSDNQNNAPFIIHSSLNYKFFQNLSAGVGAGVEFFEETHLPVTANLMYQFGNKRVVPFAMFQGGYQIALENKKEFNSYPHHSLMLSSYWPGYYTRDLKSQGGLMLNPSIGVILYTESGLGISLSAGYRYQKLNYEGDDDYKLEVEYNRVSLKLGLIF